MIWNLLDDTAVQIAFITIGCVSSLWTTYLALSRKAMAARFLRDVIQRQNSGLKVLLKGVSSVQVYSERQGADPPELSLTIKVNLFLRPSVFHNGKKIVYREVRARCSEQGWSIGDLFRDIGKIVADNGNK